MSRINISLDLERDEIFDKTIKEALLGQSRQIAREVLNEELTKEMERITDKKLNQIKTSEYYSETAIKITDILVKRLGNELTIKTPEVNKMLEEKVDEYLTKQINNCGGIEKFIEPYLNKTLLSLLRESMNIPDAGMGKVSIKNNFKPIEPHLRSRNY